MTHSASRTRNSRRTALFAALLFAILALAAAGPHPLDAAHGAAVSAGPGISASAPPAPSCLLCDFAVHSHVVIAVPMTAVAPPAATRLVAAPPSLRPAPHTSGRPTGRGPPARFT